MIAALDQELDLYLNPTYFLDSDSPDVAEYAESVCHGATTIKEKAVRLFYAVRDDVVYDLFGFEIIPSYLKASHILKKGSGYCVSKAVLLATTARAVGIRSRLGFADVVNHLNPGKLHELLQTDIFAFHGFAELFIDGNWVKATPSFDSGLCKKNGYFSPEFDGINDTRYPAFDKKGNRHMEYITYHGSYTDLPVHDLLESIKKHYPHFFSNEGITLESIIDMEGTRYNHVVREESLYYIPYSE